MGAGPMMGAPMGRGGKGGDSGHKAAAFLHGSDQDIVGDLGSVAPPVVGEVDTSAVPDIELRL